MKHRQRDSNKKQEKKQNAQNDPYKLSIHSSTNFNKSDSGSKRLNISRMLQNSRKKISMRKASELFQTSGIRPQSTKNLKRNQIIQFDNIKWISIISAYDPSRLKNVSVSKKSCQKFLSSNQQNIKNDSRNLLYFNDLIKNFKSWHNKIQMQYCYIMNKFLRQRQSANITLVQLRPKLDQVISQTLRMQQNIEDCLKSYQNHQFRQLLEKYFSSLVQCQKIEKIIISVDKSKNRIVNLYKKFEDDRKIQQKIMRVKNKGISEIKDIACDYQVQIQSQIMDKIQDAINQIAQKSGQAYRKIKGVKHLIEKFKNTQHQSQEMNKIDIEAINFMGKVCKQICYEAEAFQQFSTKFLIDGGIINQDLQKIIKKYEQEVLNERKKAIQLQMKFLNIIFSQTIKKLKENFKISTVYENADYHNQQYRKILRMIQDIADCIIDQEKRVALQRLIKETKTIFDRSYDDLKYLKQNKKFQQIDTQEGLISILQVSKLIKQYKDKILLVRKKFQSVHREIQLSKIKIQGITNDQETQFVSLVIGLSKKINNSGLKGKLQKQACFSQINEGNKLLQMSKQIENQNILEEITSISNQFLQLQSKNLLQKYFGPLKLQNLIFKESIIMVQIKNISSKTKQKNILPQLTQLLSKRNEWIEKQKKISPQMKRYFERILAFTLVKGLKPQDVKQIENPQCIPFPTKQNQIVGLKSKAKYRQVLFDLIESSAIQTVKSLIIQNTDEKSQQKARNHRVLKSAKIKNNFYVTDILERNINTINNFVDSFIKISEIKQNINSQSYLTKEYFFQFSEKLFIEVFLKKPTKNQGNQSNDKITILLKQFIEISYEKYLSLTRKILEQENQWKENEKKNNSGSQLSLNKVPVYLQKIIEVFQFYKAKTQTLYENIKLASQKLEKPQQNTENSKQQLSEYYKLSVYAKVTSALVIYCKETDQKVHVILDNSKNPIALIDPKQNVMKQIFPGLKKGKQLTLSEAQKLLIHEANIGIQLKTKKSKDQNKKEDLKRQKSKSKKKQSDMEEEIFDVEQSAIKDDMQDEYPADEDMQEIQDDNLDMPEDDMTEYLGQQVQQEPQEQMGQDFQQPEDQIEQQKIQEQALQDLIQESQNLGKSKAKVNKKTKTNNDIDQFDQYGWQQDNDKNKNKDSNKIQDLKLKEKQEEQNKQKQLQQKIKKQQDQELQRQKRLNKQHIVDSKTQIPKKILQNTIYEVLSFITSLYQLKKLIFYVSSFEENYFKNFIDWSKIQNYYNDHSSQSSEIDKKQIQKYVKNLEDDVESKLKNEFKSENNVFNQIKTLDTIKKLKKDLLLLKNGNWEALQKILSQNHVSYNILKNQNSALYIWIQQSSQQFDKLKSVHGYLSKSFKFYNRNQFDLQGFAQKCFDSKQHESKQHSYISVSYKVKVQTTFVDKFVQIENNYEKLTQTINDFSNGAKDIVNKFDFCLQLYKKALQIKQKVNLDLNWYAQQIKFLQKYGTDEFYPLTYVNFVKENVKTVIKKVKSLESKLYNLSFKCERNNLFECLDEISDLYGQQIEKKVTFFKGQTKLILFLFDKTTVKQNQEKIKRILASQPKNKEDEAQKILLNIFFSQQSTEINQDQIIKNVQKIDFKSSELLLQIIQTLRINHSYILIKNKNLEYFNLKKSNEQCISGFFQKITKTIIQNKESSNNISGSLIFTSLKQLSKPKDVSTYKQIFSKESLEKLIKLEIRNEKLYQQTRIMANEQMFMFDKVWLNQYTKLLKEILDCLNANRNQTKKILVNMKKLKPCQYIYCKRFAKDNNSSEVSKLWSQHLSVYQQLLLSAQNLINKKSWILLLNTVSQNFNKKNTHSLNENIETIKLLFKTANLQNSLEAISKQVNMIFKWLQEKDKQQSKVQFSIMILPKQKEIVYFQCNGSGFNKEQLIESFGFMDSISMELKQFLSNQLVSNITLNRNEQIKTSFELRNTDKIYEIDTQKLLQSTLNFIQSTLGLQNQQKRIKIARQIVRVFNKIYYLSRTTQNLNFKQQSSLLSSLQKEFKLDLQKLKLIYSFKIFLLSFSKTFWKNSKITQNILQILDKSLQDNEKVPQQQIQEILSKLDKIKANNKINSIDQYKPFYSWFYQTVMSILKLPFYNIITHTQVDEKTKQTQTQFLGVIVTENATKPGQQNEQLQHLLKQIFICTEHKPIYLKQNDLTVQLLKQPVFVTLDQTINGTSLKDIVIYLNENCEQQKQKEFQKILYLRVDQITKINDNQDQQRTLLKIIPLLDFVTKDQQQFNINITKQILSVEIEFNIIYAPIDLKAMPKDFIKFSIPLNGSSVDNFEKVYMGKRLKLQKIKSWINSFYLKRKKQIQVENKDKVIEEFFNGFMEYFLATVTKESREVVKKIIDRIVLKVGLENNNKSIKDQKLYLKSSLQLLQTSKKQLQKFKTKQYESKASFKKYYDQEILKLMEKIENMFYEELINVESEIKVKMVKKLKTMATEKVNEISAAIKEKRDQQEEQKINKQKASENSLKPQQDEPVQNINSNENQGQKVTLVQSKTQKQIQELNELKTINFDEYLIKKIERSFEQLTQDKIVEIENQISEKFNKQLELIGDKKTQNILQKLKQKITKQFNKKEVINETDITPHIRLFFLYFVIEKHESCYVELYLSQK